jgi:hypothetical protein
VILAFHLPCCVPIGASADDRIGESHGLGDKAHTSAIGQLSLISEATIGLRVSRDCSWVNCVNTQKSIESFPKRQFGKWALAD